MLLLLLPEHLTSEIDLLSIIFRNICRIEPPISRWRHEYLYMLDSGPDIFLPFL